MVQIFVFFMGMPNKNANLKTAQVIADGPLSLFQDRSTNLK